MMTFNLIVTLVIGIISGFIGAVSGGGGLISIPFLIFLGIPPQIVLATNKFGGLGLCLGGLYKFIKEKKIVWKYAIPLSLLGIIGSIIGSKILLMIDTSFLQKFIGIFLLLLIPTIFIKNSFGLEDIKVSKKRKVFGYLFYFLIAILASFLGGLGPITMGIVIWFLGLSIIKANATDLFAYFIYSLVSITIFAFNGIIDYKIGMVLLIGMLIGGYLGARTAIKKGNKWVKIIFMVVVIASSVKILFLN